MRPDGREPEPEAASAVSYRPKPGTQAEKIMLYLMEQKSSYAKDIALACGFPMESTWSRMDPFLKHGMVTCKKVKGRKPHGPPENVYTWIGGDRVMNNEVVQDDDVGIVQDVSIIDDFSMPFRFVIDDMRLRKIRDLEKRAARFLVDDSGNFEIEEMDGMKGHVRLSKDEAIKFCAFVTLHKDLE